MNVALPHAFYYGSPNLVLSVLWVLCEAAWVCQGVYKNQNGREMEANGRTSPPTYLRRTLRRFLFLNAGCFTFFELIAPSY